ncbi:hypothetical protein P3X46_013981 [Hevea brasiliensis]|uniref:Retrotransposon gag domain-containing protein n=1 Tax=Hevea brasiliensis TaxID=3981 RepID=A0ABQ9M5B1_HEVBR|nr:hypothetical protein P3X46_013981 [Hevea brasiliensis]
MVDNNDRPRLLRDYGAPSVQGFQSSVTRPTVEANKFELKPAWFQMIQQTQFAGSPTEDPHYHLQCFLALCDTFKMNGVSDQAIRLRAFPFSLRDRARKWLLSQSVGTFTTWENLSQAFLARYFPPAKTAKLKLELNTFTQKERESLYNTWERCKDLQRECPYHGIEDWLLVQNFYNGLLPSTRSTVDSTAEGNLMEKIVTQALELLERVAYHNYEWSNERGNARRTAGVLEVDALSMINAQFDQLIKKLERMIANIVGTNSQHEESYGGGYMSLEHNNFNVPSLEQMNYVNNRGNFNQRQPNNPYSNTYNPGWRNHPNLSWSDQQNQPINKQ